MLKQFGGLIVAVIDEKKKKDPEFGDFKSKIQ